MYLGSKDLLIEFFSEVDRSANTSNLEEKEKSIPNFPWKLTTRVILYRS